MILVLLAALGVGGYFAYGAWQQASNPQGLVEEAMRAMSELKSASLMLEADLTLTPKAGAPKADTFGTGPTTMTFNMEASYVNDPANPQLDAVITFSLPTGAELGPLGGMTLNPKISIRKKTADVMYVRLEQLPPIPFFDLSKINGQWIKIDFAELKQKYGISFDANKQQANPEQADTIAKIYRERPFLKLARLAPENVDGVQTDHLRFTLDRENLIAFLKAAVEASGQEITDAQIQQVEELFDQGLTATGELWIGKQDHFLRQLTGMMSTEVKDAGSVTANLRETFTGINQPVTIEEPVDSISLDAVMQQLQVPLAASVDQSIAVDASGEVIQQYYAPDGSVTVDGGLDSDDDGLSNFREQLLGSDYTKADSDGDGYSDAEEVGKGYNPAGTGALTPQQQEILSRFR